MLGDGETGSGKVILCADAVFRSLIMRTGGKVGEGKMEVAGESETTVPSGRVRAGDPGRIVMGVPAGGVKTRDEADGLRVMGELPIVAMTRVGAGAGAASIVAAGV